MDIQGIKKGKIIELLEEINIPDGKQVTVSIKQEGELVANLIDSKTNTTQDKGNLNFGESVLKFREKYNLEEYGIESAEEFLKGVRDQSLGREVNW